MSNKFKYDAFVSYSSKNKETVYKVDKCLRKDGVRVWLDTREIMPGDNVPDKLLDGVHNSRRLFLFVSKGSLSSAFSRIEVDCMRKQDPVNEYRSIVPIRLDDVPITELTNYIDWRDKTNTEYARLLAIAKDTRSRPQGSMKLAEEPTDKFEQLAVTIGDRVAISGHHTFPDLASDIGQCMQNASRISLLARTGMNWWRNFAPQLSDLSKKNHIRMLVIDPRDEAIFRLSERKERSWWPQDPATRRKDALTWLRTLRDNYPNIQLRIISYIPSWTLVAIEHEPKQHSTIYVEFFSYLGHRQDRASLDRPFLKVGARANGLFAFFKQQFEDSWQDGQKWQ